MNRFASLCAPLFLWIASPLNAGEPASSWPQFRGPGGQGHAEAAPIHWSEEENVVWKIELPGRGWSSPVVVDGRIWLTAAIATRDAGAGPENPLDSVKNDPRAAPMAEVAEVDLWALEFDWATGEPLRKVKLFTVDKPDPIHGFNSHASPTPVCDEGRLYCHFGDYGTACLDLETGEPRWRLQFEIEHGVGPGSSPALCDNLLIIPCDGMQQQFVAAVDTQTGKTVWRTDRPPMRTDDGDMRKAFSTPLVIETGGRRQIVVPGAQWFAAYDPANGEELWRVDHGAGFSNVPRPVFDGERLYLCTGFARPELVAVRPDGRGEVSETHVAWRWRQQVPTIPSPVVVDGLVFFISDNGVATCLDAATGKQQWRKRIAGKYCASPLAVDDRIYFCNRDGRTTIIAARPDFEVLAENDLDGSFMASPAVVDGELLLRTETHLYRVGAGASRQADGSAGDRNDAA